MATIMAFADHFCSDVIGADGGTMAADDGENGGTEASAFRQMDGTQGTLGVQSVTLLGRE